MTSPYTYKSPRSICVNCGDRIVKLDEFHDDDWWRHEHNNSHRCPFDDVVLYALPANPERIGQFKVEGVVYWQGQEGECSGNIKAITRPENSGYVLTIESDGVETYHPISSVSLSPEGDCDEGEEIDPDAPSSDFSNGQELDLAHGYGRGQ